MNTARIIVVGCTCFIAGLNVGEVITRNRLKTTMENNFAAVEKAWKERDEALAKFNPTKP